MLPATNYDDYYELWCWRRLLRVPWTARRSNQSILKETSPEYSLEGLMLKLKLRCLNTLATWCEELTRLKRPWCWERLKAEGEGDDRGWDGWMASQTQWTWVWINSGSWWWTGSDWTELTDWWYRGWQVMFLSVGWSLFLERTVLSSLQVFGLIFMN